MINLAVFFGGRTAEHDVSIITGTQFIENADKNKYNILPIYISRKGELKKCSFSPRLARVCCIKGGALA